MIAHGPLYSSRIVKNYLQYLRVHYPGLDLDAVLSQAGMTRYEVEDSAHWFTQQQTDRFHEIVAAMTGNTNLSREAGRFIVSARGMGPAKQVVLGLMSVKSVFLLLEKIFPLMTRGTGVQIKKLGSRKLEVICIPEPGVNEKPYQCDNRIGIFESLPKLFTHHYAKIEHPGCIHRGDKECRYIIQ